MSHWSCTADEHPRFLNTTKGARVAAPNVAERQRPGSSCPSATSMREAMSNVPPMKPDDSGPPGPGKQPATPAGPSPRPRETIVRPKSPHMGASDGPLLATKITALVHELANILDGSLRCLQGIQRQVSNEATPGANNCVPPSESSSANEHTADGAGSVGTRLDALRSGLLQMAGLVRSFSGASSRLGSMQIGDDGYSLAETVRHAVEVFGPVAFEQRARLSFQVSSEFEMIPSSGMFGVLASGIRNGIESIERSLTACDQTTTRDGTIRILGSVLPVENRGTHDAANQLQGTRMMVRIDIIDDGAGLSDELRRQPGRVFEFGYSTKPGSSGLGLALARDTVESHGGTIRLIHASPTHPAGLTTGATLRIEWPVVLPAAHSASEQNAHTGSTGGDA